jgi:large subunit ribosomal protein L10
MREVRLVRRDEKAIQVADVADRLGRAVTVVLVDYRGLNVSQMTELRKRLRGVGVEFKVAKNTLVLRAANQKGIDGLEDYLVGPVALAFGYNDPVAPARVLSGFVKEFRKLTIKGGILEGQVVEDTAIQQLADLPPREVLIGRVVGGIAAPLTGLVTVLNGTMRNFGSPIDKT